LLLEQNFRIEEENTLDELSKLVDRLDFLDIQILRKFYISGKEYPLDTQPFCFPILYQEMKTTYKIKVGLEGLRKRMDGLVKLGLLEKIKHSNPVSYSPIAERSAGVRGVITKFFLINGLTRFL
jgi:hypothetical protein